MKISVTTLRRFYQHHSVRFRTARQAYKIAMNKREELDVERKEFALLLANILAKELPLIYVDETTFNNQTVPRKAWTIGKVPVLHGILTTRRSATVYGAIGTCLKEPVYLVITADDCKVDPETGKKQSRATN